MKICFQGAHGFVKDSKTWPSVGAAINVEASGASGPGKHLLDLVHRKLCG